MRASSLDHLVGGAEQCGRNGEAEHRCSLEIDDKLEFDRLFYGQIAGIGALKNSVDVACGAAKNITVVWSITDQAACIGKCPRVIHRRQSTSRGQSQDWVSLTIEDRIGNNDEGLHSLFLYLFERILNRKISGNRHRINPHVQSLRRNLRLPQLHL